MTLVFGVWLFPRRGTDPPAATGASFAPGRTGFELFELQQRAEREITGKLLHTLEPYVGPGKIRTTVTAEIEYGQGEQTEEVVGPNPVVVTSQKTEEQSRPGSEAEGGPAAGRSGLVRKQESSTYQPSKTIRHRKSGKGSLQRLSIAVLVDHRAVVDASGRRSTAPRTPQELKTIRGLIVAAAGIMEARGDLLTMESFPFQTPPDAGVPEGPGSIGGLGWVRSVQMGGAAVLVALPALWWWRRRKQSGLSSPQASPGDTELTRAQPPNRDTGQRTASDTGLPDQTPRLSTDKAILLQQILSEKARRDPGATVQILRNWIHEQQ